ncbi:DNA-binding protein [Aliarcobacter butzleri]|uniref:DNA-binding protein n=1 Tax=Aliarcobacter butzleri TaxID=28197 RepID=UPI002B248543|nr:DNA-binding protein [Aliarcobacter butzleri]
MFEKYDMLIPQGVIFNLKEIEDMKIIKSDMAKKLIYNNELEVVKIGKKIHISRTELIRFLVACSSRFIRTVCRSDSDSFKVEIF